MRGLMFSMIN